MAVCDHIAIPEDKAAVMSTEWWDTIATLGWLAGITERTRLLSHIYVPAYRHPMQVAKAFSTLDAVSGGRVIMGVGAGHVEAEFEMLGLPFAERGRLLDESIDALRAAFAEDYPTLPGPEWPLADMGQHPRPVQEDGPPIWVGGSSPAAVRRAAVRGDGWLPQGPVDGDGHPQPADAEPSHRSKGKAVGGPLHHLRKKNPDRPRARAPRHHDTTNQITGAQRKNAVHEGADVDGMEQHARTGLHGLQQISPAPSLQHAGRCVE